jgi:hypothetical protein
MPDCGGQLRLMSTIEDLAVVENVLTGLGLPIVRPLRILAKADTDSD